jgi:ABC-type antimicrobial peptide transport system permease subunit
MMKYYELFKTALAALLSNKARTALTMLGIVIGIMSVILITALSTGGKAKINEHFSKLGTGIVFLVSGKVGDSIVSDSGSFSKPNVTYEDAQFLRSQTLSGVSGISGYVTSSFGVSSDDSKSVNYAVFGVQESYDMLYNITTTAGEFITADDELSQSRVAVVGSSLPEKLFGRGVDPLGKDITIDNKIYTIKGVAASRGRSLTGDQDTNIYLPLASSLAPLFGKDTVDDIEIGVSNPATIPLVKQEITTIMFERRGISSEEERNFTLLTLDQQLSSFNTILAAVSALLAGIAAISLVVGGIGIMNIMLVTVTERTREVGLLKAIGAKQSDILAQFLIEAVVLTFISGVIGVVLGVLIDLVAAKALNIPFGITPGAVLLAVGVSSIVGIVFGLYPARKAARLNPIDALRFE